MLASVCARQGKQGRETGLGTSNRVSLATGTDSLRRVRGPSYCRANQPFSRCKLVSVTTHLLIVNKNDGIHKVLKGFSEAYAVIAVLFVF